MTLGFAVPLHAITLHPEWAFAFVHLGKRVENRTWRPAADMLPLPLCIHAGAHVGGAASKHACEAGLEGLFTHASVAGWGLDHEIRKGSDGFNVWISGRHEDGRVLPRTLVQRRAIVAVAEFGSIEQIGPRLQPLTTDPWVASDCYAWRASRVLAIADPVTCREGKQGLWPISASRFVKLQRRVADAVFAEHRRAASG